MRCMLVLCACLALTNAAGAQAATPPEDPFVSFGSLNRAFVLFDEPQQIIDSFREQTPGEDAAVIEAKLKAIFPDGPRQDEASVLRMLSCVAQSIRLKFTATPLGSDVLQQGFGYCYGMALAFVALCRGAGLPARVNTFRNLEVMEAHNMAEVYYDGAWHLFDPTFGVFFYTSANWPGGGRIASLRELAAHQTPRHAFQVTGNLWSGAFDGKAEASKVAPETKCGDYPFTLSEFYDRLFSRAFPVVASDGAAASYPLDLDLREKDELWLGKPDGDVMDQFGRDDTGRYPRFAGVPVIGKSQLGSVVQTITFRVARPGRYRLTYHMAAGSRHDRMAVVELKNVVAGQAVADKDTWTLECYVQDTEAVFLVANRYHAALVDALHVQRLADSE